MRRCRRESTDWSTTSSALSICFWYQLVEMRMAFNTKRYSTGCCNRPRHSESYLWKLNNVQIGTKTLAVGENQTASFKPVSREDDHFLIELYRSTRLEELALTDWSENQRAAFVEMQFRAQQSHYREYYPKGEHYLVLAGEIGIG